MPSRQFLVPVLFLLFFSLSVAALPAIKLITQSGIKTGPHLNNVKTTNSVSFVNAGNSDLTIYKLRKSCACAKLTKPSSMVFSPGETGTFHVVFDLDGELQKGDRTYTIFIESNDPYQPVINWYTVVDIIPIVNIVPDKLDFRPGNAATQSVTIITQPIVYNEPLQTSLMMTMGSMETNYPGWRPTADLFGWSFSSPLAAGTNVFTVWRNYNPVRTRYGRSVISIDASRYFNIVEFKTERLPRQRK